MINNVCLVGRAGANPEMKYFDSGKVVTTINMAVSRSSKEPITDWIQIKLWGKLAETAGAYIKKGHLFGVTGELQQELWDKNGEKREKVVVVGNKVKLMQPKAAGSKDNTQDIFSTTEEIAL